MFSYSEYDLREMFNEMLTECYPEVSICGYKYNAAEAFETMDPTAYTLSFLEWIDNEGYIEEEGNSTRYKLKEGA